MKVQRLRVTFARGDELKYITHLDLMRCWERTLRRADLPVAYSEGFTPHAQISLAAPLAVGTTSDAELMDVYMDTPVLPRRFIEQASPQLPAGLGIVSVQEAGMALPALQAEVRFAAYDVDVPAGGSQDAATDAARAVDALLAAETFPWEHMREDEVKRYDLRALVRDLEVVPRDGPTVRLRMLLQNDSNGAGRPEQVVAALGLPAPVRIHRTALLLANTSPARDAWRKRGRFIA